MQTYHVATVPSTLPDDLADALFTCVETTLVELGATRVWIDAAVRSAAHVMAEVPDEALTQRELRTPA